MEKYFGNNLRTLRNSINYTQEALAKNLNIKRATIASYEEGRAEPKYNNLILFSDFFNISIDDLLRFEIRYAHDGELPENRVIRYFKIKNKYEIKTTSR